MTDQTIPNSNGDYIKDVIPASWGKIDCDKIPEPFTSTILMFGGEALTFGGTLLAFRG